MSYDPAGPSPTTPPPPFATLAVTPIGVIVQFPAPAEVTIRVTYPPSGTLLIVRFTFPVWVATWFGELL